MTSSPDLSSPALTLQLQPYELHLLAWTPCDAMPLADIFPTQLPGGGKAFHSITVTEEEVSVLAERKEAERLLRLLEEKRVEMLGESSVWRALKVKGPLDLSLVGILHHLTAPLARVGVSIFASSTYKTDYVLVPHGKVEMAIAGLREAGWTVEENTEA